MILPLDQTPPISLRDQIVSAIRRAIGQGTSGAGPWCRRPGELAEGLAAACNSVLVSRRGRPVLVARANRPEPARRGADAQPHRASARTRS